MTSHSSVSSTSVGIYQVFKVRYKLGMADPDMPGPRWHTVVFVETERGGEGFIHHVVGDLVNGMTYERKLSRRPEMSRSFHDKEYLGIVSASSYPSTVEAICRSEPAPPRQKAFNTKTMRYEPVKSDGSFYQPGEHRIPLKKCTEWTEEQLIPTLLRQGIIRRTSGS